MDWQARLYVKVADHTYRIKVFENAVGLEQQPGGPNRFYDRHDDPVVAAVYDTPNERWDLQALAQLIVRYENESEALGALDLDTWTETTAPHALPPSVVEHISADITPWQPSDPIPQLPPPKRVDPDARNEEGQPQTSSPSSLKT